LRLILTPEEPHHQHAQCKRTAGKRHRLPSSESFDIGDDLIRVAPIQISAETLDLFRTTIGILREHRLHAFFPKVVACLTKGLRYPGHRFGHVLFAHIQPRRDLLCGLFHNRSALTAAGATVVLIGAGQPTCSVLNRVDNLTRHMVGPVPHRGRRIAGLTA